ncbi:low affinity immunoglobulin epsilon Fc receptor-like [Haliotis rufescens]|uniref:low affinity immunoglobulin epsilon Fc receptor-like n=1 Tax=Haliotis rufescens TaxID=6454 RepID=UPI00201F9343|nr:low affinity immunoglobulin epsilon Fc receptor-like [Haliotis rufescens]XP_048238243.1 low affinity immunoglobulin epsilon Fc receptor-like [Haliotis rufescens]
MTWLYILSLLVICSTVKGDCPNLWVTFDGACYFLFEDLEAWPQASSICGLHSSDLVSIDSSKENEFVKNYAKTRQAHPVSVWIGANDMMTSGQFLWSDGDRKVTVTDWARGEPNNHNGGENCVELEIRNGFMWNDALCRDRKHFICEQRPGPVVGK